MSSTRPFHLATGATALIHRLGPPLRQIRKRFPKARLNITVAATEEMITGLVQRRFDLAIISLPLPVEQPLLRIIPLYDEELLVLRPSLTRVAGWHVASVQPRDLKGVPFILYPKRSNMRTMINGMFRELGFEPEIAMEYRDDQGSGIRWARLLSAAGVRLAAAAAVLPGVPGGWAAADAATGAGDAAKRLCASTDGVDREVFD